MELLQDAIIDIPERQYGYFGGPGKLLLPSRAAAEAVVRQIPAGKLLTTDRLRQMLADQAGVQGTCPETTRKALRAIGAESSDVPYWRVVKQNGELIAYFPGGVEAQAALLEDEGIRVDRAGKTPKVDKLNEKSASFAS